MESEHSVSSHLRLDTAGYDRVIRTYIPYYDESRAVQLDLLAAAQPAATARIIDLGGGTGSLAAAILQRFPQASVLVRDIDPDMLAVAQRRLAPYMDRVELSLGSFDQPLPPADAVLSAFALHHVPRLEQKAEVYARIREAVRPGGVFLNNDAASGPFWPWLRDQWAAFMAGQGFTLEQGYRNLDDWASEDTYFSVREELAAMLQAGFEQPECFWRRGPVSILGARL
jgi:ubiquinone/menaquinone biosynthesis C-methylase UbiE